MRATTLLTILSILLVGSPAFAQKSDAKKSDAKKPETKKVEDDKKPEEKKADEKKPDEKKPDDPNAANGASAANATKSVGAADDWNVNDVEETTGRTYFFVGLRY